jgi:peptide/nickel transport system permease protein
MKLLRAAALILLAVVTLLALTAEWIAPAPYDRQFRDTVNAAPSREHPLGTDELGRDRVSRLIYGTRVSLLLAPLAALLASLLSGMAGVFAAWKRSFWQRGVEISSDLFLSLPWMFLLLTVRAALPLNLAPWAAVTVTFLLLGVLGWAAPSRVALAGAQALCDSDFLLLARAQGCRGASLLSMHLLPNLRPVFLAQFWTSIPLFILTEANLSMLGLGVMEPLPSWGLLLRELENVSAIPRRPWILAPAILLFAVVTSLHIVLPRKEAIS